MRSIFGQAGDNVAIKRTIKQKELLIHELEDTLGRVSNALRAQLKVRISALRTEIRLEKQAVDRSIREKEHAKEARQVEVESRRRPQKVA